MIPYWLGILGLQETANESDIKKAYRALAKEYHPDTSTHFNSKNKFIEITEAYNNLLEILEKAKTETVENNDEYIENLIRYEKRKQKTSNVRYKKQKKSNSGSYKEDSLIAKSLSESLNFFALGIGLTILFSVLHSLINQDVLQTDKSTHIASNVIISLVGFAIAGYSGYLIFNQTKFKKGNQS